jgi:hypothetical protein
LSRSNLGVADKRAVSTVEIRQKKMRGLDANLSMFARNRVIVDDHVALDRSPDGGDCRPKRKAQGRFGDAPEKVQIGHGIGLLWESIKFIHCDINLFRSLIQAPFRQ